MKLAAKERLNLYLKGGIKFATFAYCESLGSGPSDLIEELLREFLQKKGVLQTGPVLEFTEEWEPKIRAYLARLASGPELKKQEAAEIAQLDSEAQEAERRLREQESKEKAARAKDFPKPPAA